MTGIRLSCTALSALAVLGVAGVAHADTTPQAVPFSQDWSDTGLITTNDDWSGVPGITGYFGEDLTGGTAVDPQTLLAPSTSTVDVIANQATAGSTAGGVGEFELVDPVVALQGSGSADAPHLLIRLDTSSVGGVRVQYNVRDIDGSADNAVQPVALQYRVGTAGNFINVPAAFVADATTGPSLATAVTAVDVLLPPAAAGQAVVELRIITTNATSSDEWVGIDDLSITAAPFTATGAATPATVARGANTALDVTVIRGSTPLSTGVTVTCDLTAIGGAVDQALVDDGTGGDLFAGDHVYSFTAAVPVGTALGAASIPCTAEDAEARSDATTIELTIIDPPTDPTGIGTATPSNLAAGDETLLSVIVTPGTNPASTGVGVVCDTTPLGGGAGVTLFDDGAHEDGAAGDLTFAARVTSGATTSAGTKFVTCTVSDGQARASDAPIALTVVAVCGDGRVEGTEGCDDDDLDNGDGCNAVCVVESGWDCAGTAPSVCTDIDECATEADDCVALAACNDTDGGFTCACPAGYAGDGEASGTGCTDIDECAAETDDCVALAACNDTDGDYTCTCPAGYAGDGEAGGTGCTDIDECATETDDCVAGAACNDLDGGFACACPAGFAGDGRASGTGCADIDECAAETDDCVAIAACADVDGGFTCTCPAGYTGDGEASGSGCIDVDECAASLDDCVAAATCTDTDGGFTCACPAGYAGDGRTGGTGCADIDECATGADDCDANATCTDAEGSFTCACNTGFSGSGTTCAPVCGDELIVAGEACDDGNDDPLDGCDETCAVEDGWACSGTPSECAGICGDGLVRDAEECDDAGTDDGDGCDAGCVVEPGFNCDSSEPSECSPSALCGDGAVDGGEDCDDGNDDAEDGCDPTCEVEPGYACDDGEPSDCERDGDGDGVGNSADNCPVDPNPAQTDSDDDGVGDVCDAELVDQGCCSTGGGDPTGAVGLALATIVATIRRRRRPRA